MRAGTPIEDASRRLGIEPSLLRRYQKRFDPPRMTELRELRRLRDENAKLRALISDLLLDRSILEEVLRNS